MSSIPHVHDYHVTYLYLKGRELVLLAQVSEVTAEKHRLKDTIFRLKSERIASSTSLTEALDQLEKEKAAAVSNWWHYALTLQHYTSFLIRLQPEVS